MDKSTPPSVKTWSFMPENPSISVQPYVPASNEGHLSKKSLGKIPPGLYNNVTHVIPIWSSNLQVVLNFCTKVTLKNR